MSKYQFKEVRVKLCEGNILYSDSPVNTPERAREMMRMIMEDSDREEAYVINLDSKCRPINYHLVSVGSLDHVEVNFANVFKSAILSNANGIILLHNHPSGDPTPSDLDNDLTARLRQAGGLMGIPLMDHVIIGAKGSSFSYYESGLFRTKRKGQGKCLKTSAQSSLFTPQTEV